MENHIENNLNNLNNSNNNLPCPHTEIKISASREIINCDNLSFPWTQDPKGYFLVKLINNIICCGFVNPNHELMIEFRGKDPDKIIKEIVKRDICSRGNLAYISSELMIAYNCIKDNQPYTQR